MLGAFFVISGNHKRSIICALIKVDWLATCIALQDGWLCMYSICHFPPALAYKLHSPPGAANGKQGLIPEEVSQT
jgi:hypothetical protein